MDSHGLLLSLAAIVAAYLLGSLSFAVIVSRVVGLADPRSYGSGNPGATNVLRSGHKGAAALTLAFDVLKGYVPVFLALWWREPLGFGLATVALVGLAAFVGHLWPVFFRFQGGKGVATAAGVLMAINPMLGLATLLSWVLVAAFFRYSSLASIVAAAFAPFYQALIWGIEPALLDFQPEVLAEIAHVRDAFDDHVPGLPTFRRPPHHVVHGHTGSVVPPDFGTHRSRVRRSVRPEWQELHAIRGEIENGSAVSFQQRAIQTADETGTLFGRRVAVMRPQYQTTGILEVEIRRQQAVRGA